MFVFTSKIKIGFFTFNGGFSELLIRKDVRLVTDTATIKLPGLARGLGEKFSNIRTNTADFFKVGDAVNIELGYNNDLRTEFEGFVARIIPGPQLTLELEGFTYQLRTKTINKSWRNTTVKEVLQEITKGTDIKISPSVPAIPLEKFYTPNKTGLQVLEYLSRELRLSVYFKGNTLYAGLEQGLMGDSVKYKIGWNTISDTLAINNDEEKPVLIKVHYKSDKKSKIYEVGTNGGDTHTIKLPNITSVAIAEKIGNEALKKKKEHRYAGKITAFLQPYCEPGFKAIVEDPRYKVKDGSYFIDSVDVKVSMRGARRIFGISTRLN